MKIGIWLSDDFNPEAGGAFSYLERLIIALDNYDFGQDIKLCFVTAGHSVSYPFKKPVISLRVIPRLFWRLSFLNRLLIKIEKEYLCRKGYRLFERSGISVMYYLKQGVCVCPDFPFIATNWDIGHSSTFPFPELCDKKQFKRRTHFYDTVLPRALMVLVDSESGKNEMLRYTKLGNHKIWVTPIFAGGMIDAIVSQDTQMNMLIKNNLAQYRYFIYPAQFWAHKNHVGLVKAFAAFVKNNSDYKLVFSGSNKGNTDYVKGIIKQLNIEDKIVFLGFVSNEELKSLYVNAAAVIMASHFGPTNMPPIEALELGVPVVCSDLTGHREILGDSGVYFDSFSVDSITNALTQLVADRTKYTELIKQRQKESIFKIDYTVNEIKIALNKVVTIRENWQ